MKVGACIREGRFEELAYRESDGIEVFLIWNRASNGLSVFVIDTKLDQSFELCVEDEAPLDVFNHPYAFAAARRVLDDQNPAHA